jgi:GntR family transcriptional regulator
MANEQHARQRFEAPALALDASIGVALYVQLADIFRYHIRSGLWSNGYRLDNFERLAAHYSVARITVRQAVARLVQEGLLTSQRGRGTIVCKARSEPLGLAGDVSFRFIYKARTTQLPPEFLGGFEAFERYVELTKVHVVDNIPFGMIRIYVAADVYRRFPRRAIEKTKVLRLVLAHAPEHAEHMRQRMTVEPADLMVAQHLQCSVGAPVAKILRQIHGADHRLSYAGLSWYRGDAFEMDMTLPRELIQDSSPALIAPGVRHGNR